MGDRAASIRMYNAAFEAVRNQNYKDWATHAFGLLQSSCIVDPTMGQAWADNANSNGDIGRLHAAVACYRRALDGDLGTDKQIEVLSNISWRLNQLGELEEALAFAQRAVELGPHEAYPWVNLSQAHGAFGQRLAAVETARKAYELKPSDTATQFNLAFALLFNEEYAEGFKFLESRFEHRLKNYLTYPYPKWEGEKDCTVFLVADQGMGDTLSFSRFLDHASKRARYIHAMVQPALLRAFTEAFVHLPNINFTPTSTSYPQADAWTTFVSLPYALKLTDQEIKDAPHPRLPVYGVVDTWKMPDVKCHIGIAWAGSALNDLDKWRSFPLTNFLDLYKVPGIQLYSLQMDERKRDLGDFCCESLVRDMSGWVSDVVDTVAVMQHLDLIITCESALAHIAGSIGKEVWIPYSFHAHDYRLGHDGKSMLWYGKTHRLFIQDRDMRWDKVFQRIVLALREKVNGLAKQTGEVGKGHGPRKVARG